MQQQMRQNVRVDTMQNTFDINAIAKAFNIEALQTASQRNLDAFKKANAIIVEGWSQIATRQMEQLQSSVQQSTEIAKDLSSAKGLEDLLQKQSTAWKTAVERTVTNSQEIADIARRTQTAATEVLSKTASQVASEWQNATQTAAQNWSTAATKTATAK